MKLDWEPFWMPPPFLKLTVFGLVVTLTFEFKVWSVHPCPQMHQHSRYVLSNIVFTNYRDAHTDSPAQKHDVSSTVLTVGSYKMEL